MLLQTTSTDKVTKHSQPMFSERISERKVKDGV